jgi:hypothetical protein
VEDTCKNGLGLGGTIKNANRAIIPREAAEYSPILGKNKRLNISFSLKLLE